MSLNDKLLNAVPLKIFTYLCRVSHIPHYEREIARSVEASVGATNQTLKLLLTMEVVVREKKGQLYLYRVITDHPIVREFKKFENVLELNPLLLRIREVSNKIVLYGSCATGEDTLESDIDLFIISKEKEKIFREIRRETREVKREIKSIIVSVEEYLSMRNKKEPILEEVDKGIVLYEKKR
ncbi:MAG: nucleotidyltransferase domain-containing protein [Thermodesulfobacteriota bacterium]